MMRAILLIICLFSFGRSSAQMQSEANYLSTGVIDTLYSSVLKEKRTLLVYVPKPQDSLMAKVKYPVLYLLGGEDYFLSIANQLQYLSSTFGNDVYPEMMVVGIVSSDNVNDYLPSISDRNNLPLNQSGKDPFTNFLESELLPFIDSNYPAAPYRMLFGHSLAGLRTVNTLVYSPGIFNAYIAIDPSLGHDDRKWFKQGIVDVMDQHYRNNALYIAMAHTMPQLMDTAAIMQDTSGNSRHMRSIMDFARQLERVQQKGLAFSWHYYPGETHGSVPMLATYDALHWLYAGYSLKYFKEIASMSIDSAKRFVDLHYSKLSDKLGYTMLPPESVIRNLANYLQSKSQVVKATYFLELNAANYPSSYQALVALGDRYVTIDKRKEAALLYERALRIHEAADTKEKLSKLRMSLQQ